MSPNINALNVLKESPTNETCLHKGRYRTFTDSIFPILLTGFSVVYLPLIPLLIVIVTGSLFFWRDL